VIKDNLSKFTNVGKIYAGQVWVSSINPHLHPPIYAIVENKSLTKIVVKNNHFIKSRKNKIWIQSQAEMIKLWIILIEFYLKIKYYIVNPTEKSLILKLVIK